MPVYVCPICDRMELNDEKNTTPVPVCKHYDFAGKVRMVAMKRYRDRTDRAEACAELMRPSSDQ